MKNIFNKSPPIEILYNILKIYCEVIDNNYKLDNIAYKKLLFFNKISEFLNEIKNYYHINKKFYCERDTTFNNFITIIRHILKYHNIYFYKKIKYMNGNYNIIYFIDLCGNTF